MWLSSLHSAAAVSSDLPKAVSHHSAPACHSGHSRALTYPPRIAPASGHGPAFHRITYVAHALVMHALVGILVICTYCVGMAFISTAFLDIACTKILCSLYCTYFALSLRFRWRLSLSGHLNVQMRLRQADDSNIANFVELIADLESLQAPEAR
jgi:hypothetical protein